MLSFVACRIWKDATFTDLSASYDYLKHLQIWKQIFVGSFLRDVEFFLCVELALEELFNRQYYVLFCFVLFTKVNIF